MPCDLDFDVAIIGGGVVGLALAEALSRTHQTLLVERHPKCGTETSSRNSEVIHGALYYPEDSLKTQLCLEGKARLYAYCQRHGIDHAPIGKLIVADHANSDAISQIETRASHLGIPLARLSRAQINQYAPDIQARDALFSPSTGIVDSHGLMQCLQQQSERQGALVMNHTCFDGADFEQDHWRLSLRSCLEPCTIKARVLINAAGLSAHEVSTAIRSPLPVLTMPIFPCRGVYFRYQGKHPFQHLVYPTPDKNLAGLGIHATLDLAGQLKFGPDVQYLKASISDPESIGAYQLSAEEIKTKHVQFCHAIARYWPGLDATRLAFDYVGIRPKLSSKGEGARDFVIDQNHPLLFQLLGIESPGLTSALALAERIRQALS